MDYFELNIPNNLDLAVRQMNRLDISSQQNKAQGLRHFTVKSEENRNIPLYQFGNGALKVSLLAGCHSDEPVGPLTLDLIIRELINFPGKYVDLLNKYTFFICPHINPDGESKNRKWIEKWPDYKSYLQFAFRETPGRDVEFGFPEMRIENKGFSDFIHTNAPFDLHISLHGMGISEGPMLLLEKNWADKCKPLKNSFSKLVQKMGYRLHDHDRQGEKGFQYYGPGFTSTPEAKEMKKFFLNQNNPEMASKFHLSSMEYIRSLGGDPLCIVTEIPLWYIGKQHPQHNPRGPINHTLIKEKIKNTSNVETLLNELEEKFDFRAFPLSDAIELQLNTLNLGLQLISKLH